MVIQHIVKWLSDLYNICIYIYEFIYIYIYILYIIYIIYIIYILCIYIYIYIYCYIVIIYHPLLKGFAKVVKKHLHLLHMNDKVKKAFTPGPMVSFQERQKFRSYPVRIELYPLERLVGSFKCNGKRCQVCINVTK